MNNNEESLYRQYKILLFSIAYRMLGTVTEAEDIVQDTFLTYFQKKDSVEILNEKAYLCKVATNLCIDLLRTARKKREVYTGPWLPEPYIPSEEGNPLDQMLKLDGLSISYLIMMEKLSPTERAVFILKDVFGYSYKDISSMIEKTEVNCRKIFERAKTKLGEKIENTKLNNEKNQSVISDFISAFQKGDMKRVLMLVSENVTLYSDGGGVVKAAINPIYSRERVLAFLLGVVSKAPAELKTTFEKVNGQLGMVNTVNTVPHSVISFHIEDEQINGIYIVMNPEKLTRIESR